jgi:hypothetical protein
VVVVVGGGLQPPGQVPIPGKKINAELPMLTQSSSYTFVRQNQFTSSYVWQHDPLRGVVDVVDDDECDELLDEDELELELDDDDDELDDELDELELVVEVVVVVVVDVQGVVAKSMSHSTTSAASNSQPMVERSLG